MYPLCLTNPKPRPKLPVCLKIQFTNRFQRLGTPQKHQKPLPGDTYQVV